MMIEINISFPLDDDGFFRRECPLCMREFKVLFEKEELDDIAQNGLETFLIEKEESSSIDQAIPEKDFVCPYCGQESEQGKWWTQEQLAYTMVYAKNIMAKLVNEEFMGPLKRKFGRKSSGMLSLRFEGKEIQQQEPWISPEVNDLAIFDLPCCQRKIKILDDWTETVYCFFCNYPYKIRKT